MQRKHATEEKLFGGGESLRKTAKTLRRTNKRAFRLKALAQGFAYFCLFVCLSGPVIPSYFFRSCCFAISAAAILLKRPKVLKLDDVMVSLRLTQATSCEFWSEIVMCPV